MDNFVLDLVDFFEKIGYKISLWLMLFKVKVGNCFVILKGYMRGWIVDF